MFCNFNKYDHVYLCALNICTVEMLRPTSEGCARAAIWRQCLMCIDVCAAP